jgi:hypothetical protein
VGPNQFPTLLFVAKLDTGDKRLSRVSECLIDIA